MLPLKWTTVRGKTSSAWPEPLLLGMPVGMEEPGVGLAAAEAEEADEDESDPPLLEEQAARAGRAVASPARASAERRL